LNWRTIVRELNGFRTLKIFAVDLHPSAAMNPDAVEKAFEITSTAEGWESSDIFFCE
jgi:hypothetical protein